MHDMVVVIYLPFQYKFRKIQTKRSTKSALFHIFSASLIPIARMKTINTIKVTLMPQVFYRAAMITALELGVADQPLQLKVKLELRFNCLTHFFLDAEDTIFDMTSSQHNLSSSWSSNLSRVSHPTYGGSMMKSLMENDRSISNPQMILLTTK